MDIKEFLYNHRRIIIILLIIFFIALLAYLILHFSDSSNENIKEILGLLD